jgi:uncharacterized protein YbjT (DUF2867 family)
MARTFLVIGATGTVGGATLNALRASRVEPVAFVRDARRAAGLLGERTPVRIGDLADEGSVREALAGIDAVLLCSAHGPAMRQHQEAAVRAIAASGVNRVVKISGSPVSVRADSPASTGRDHFEVERALRAIGRDTVAIRPNPFMQNFLEQAPVTAHGALPGPDGSPRVSFVDARDVGRVAAAALLAEQPPEAVLEVTGPEALTWFDVAGTMSEVLGRPVAHYPTPPDAIRQAMLAMGRPQWLVEHMLELAALLRDPEAGEVTNTVERITGQPPITLREFFTDHASAFPAAA